MGDEQTSADCRMLKTSAMPECEFCFERRRFEAPDDWPLLGKSKEGPRANGWRGSEPKDGGADDNLFELFCEHDAVDEDNIAAAVRPPRSSLDTEHDHYARRVDAVGQLRVQGLFFEPWTAVRVLFAPRLELRRMRGFVFRFQPPLRASSAWSATREQSRTADAPCSPLSIHPKPSTSKRHAR